MGDLTRIYNHGDMANPPHWGTITAQHADDWGSYVTIQPDNEDYTYTVPAYMVGHFYEGNGLTRIVTESAYQTWHAAQLAKLQLTTERA